MTDASSALHRYRSKAQKAEDLTSLQMLTIHLKSIKAQEDRLLQAIETAETIMNTTFATKAFENFSKKKDVSAIRENYKNLLNHEVRKERDASLAEEYTSELRLRNKKAAEALQAKKNEREYWRQMVRALHETDAARQVTHTELDQTRRTLKTQISSTRAELEKRLALKSHLKTAIADLQMQLLEVESKLKTTQKTRTQTNKNVNIF